MQTAVHGVSMLIQDYDDHSFVFASLGPSLVQCVESDSGLILLIEHDLTDGFHFSGSWPPFAARCPAMGNP